MLTSGANVPDISRALDLLDCYPPIAGRPGRPRRRFEVLLADKGYSSEAFRPACRERGTEPIIPKPKTHGIKGLGKLRYVVEQIHGAADVGHVRAGRERVDRGAVPVAD